ncbi:hypothetical protein [Nocardia rhizosphaerae]|uniref:Uncharacterized protein n=1 Tax=Nocardia rhizosphaerae TaxID=1691571 RepID=A0ABV8L7A6_9NOCA
MDEWVIGNSKREMPSKTPIALSQSIGDNVMVSSRGYQTDFAFRRNPDSVIYLDSAALPDDVRIKVRARLRNGRSCIDNRDKTPERVSGILVSASIIAGLWLFPAGLLGSILASSITESQTDNSGPDTMRQVCIALILLIAPAVYILIRLTKRIGITSDKLRLTDPERELMHSGTRIIEFSATTTLDDLSRTDGYCQCGDLLAIAHSLFDNLTRSDAWSSRFLINVRNEIDIQQEWFDVVQRTVEFHSIEQHLGSRPVGNSTSAELAQREWDMTNAALTRIWDGLRKQVAAIESLYESVHNLDQDLAYSTTASRAEELGRRLAESGAYDIAYRKSEFETAAHAEHVTAISSAINELVRHSPDRLETLKAFAPETPHQD